MLQSILKSPALLSIVNGQLRHVGTLAAGSLVTHGWVDGSDTEKVIGIVVAIGVMIWSAVAKKMAA
jgi:hypothetical protein